MNEHVSPLSWDRMHGRVCRKPATQNKQACTTAFYTLVALDELCFLLYRHNFVKMAEAGNGSGMVIIMHIT